MSLCHVFSLLVIHVEVQSSSIRRLVAGLFRFLDQMWLWYVRVLPVLIAFCLWQLTLLLKLSSLAGAEMIGMWCKGSWWSWPGPSLFLVVSPVFFNWSLCLALLINIRYSVHLSYQSLSHRSLVFGCQCSWPKLLKFNLMQWSVELCVHVIAWQGCGTWYMYVKREFQSVNLVIGIWNEETLCSNIPRVMRLEVLISSTVVRECGQRNQSPFFRPLSFVLALGIPMMYGVLSNFFVTHVWMWCRLSVWSGATLAKGTAAGWPDTSKRIECFLCHVAHLQWYVLRSVQLCTCTAVLVLQVFANVFEDSRCTYQPLLSCGYASTLILRAFDVGLLKYWNYCRNPEKSTEFCSVSPLCSIAAVVRYSMVATLSPDHCWPWSFWWCLAWFCTS